MALPQLQNGRDGWRFADALVRTSKAIHIGLIFGWPSPVNDREIVAETSRDQLMQPDRNGPLLTPSLSLKFKLQILATD